MGKYLLATAVGLVGLVPVSVPVANGEEPLVLENDRMGLSFDRKMGTLTALDNKLTGEIYRVRGDEFAVGALGLFEVSQDYPESDRSVRVLHGETVRWEVSGETAVVLKVQPVDPLGSFQQFRHTNPRRDF